MGPLAVWPGQAELAGEGDELALVVVLAPSGGIVDPAGMGEGVDGLVEHGLQGLAGAFGQAFAGDEQLGLAAGRRPVEGGALAVFGGVALARWSAPTWPCGVEMDGAGGQAGAGQDHDLGELGGWRRLVRVCSRAAMSPEPVVASAPALVALQAC